MLELAAALFGVLAAGLLMPDIFNATPPEGGGMNEYLSGEKGRVVPPMTETKHPLWVEVRGELWRAHSTDQRLRVGAEVEVVGTDGLVANVVATPSSPAVAKAVRKRDPGGMRSLRWGLVSWGLSCALCWMAVGSPLYAVLGVPAVIALVFCSVAGFGEA